MQETELTARIEYLEERLSHQEAALEELTRGLLGQAQTLQQQAESIATLQAQIRALAVSPQAAHDDEVPPHY